MATKEAAMGKVSATVVDETRTRQAEPAAVAPGPVMATAEPEPIAIAPVSVAPLAPVPVDERMRRDLDRALQIASEAKASATTARRLVVLFAIMLLLGFGVAGYLHFGLMP